MMIGRDYRKFLSQTWAYIAYRWIIIWVLVTACASKGQAGVAVGMAIAAVDTLAAGSHKGLVLMLNAQSSKDWLDRLTNRLFYKQFFEQVRAGGSEFIDIDAIFQAASKEAVADINKASEDSKLTSGFWDATGWHWFGGIISFIWNFVGFALYYGSALYLGSGGTF